MFSWEWSNMSSRSCAFYMKIRGGQTETAERRDDPARFSTLTVHLNQLWFGINLCTPPIGQTVRTAQTEASHWLRPAVICNQFLSRSSTINPAISGLSDHGTMTDFLPLSKRGQKVENWTGNILVLFFLLDLESGLASLASDLESLLS